MGLLVSGGGVAPFGGNADVHVAILTPTRILTWIDGTDGNQLRYKIYDQDLALVHSGTVGHTTITPRGRVLVQSTRDSTRFVILFARTGLVYGGSVASPIRYDPTLDRMVEEGADLEPGVGWINTALGSSPSIHSPYYTAEHADYATQLADVDTRAIFVDDLVPFTYTVSASQSTTAQVSQRATHLGGSKWLLVLWVLGTVRLRRTSGAATEDLSGGWFVFVEYDGATGVYEVTDSLHLWSSAVGATAALSGDEGLIPGSISGTRTCRVFGIDPNVGGTTFVLHFDYWVSGGPTAWLDELRESGDIEEEDVPFIGISDPAGAGSGTQLARMWVMAGRGVAYDSGHLTGSTVQSTEQNALGTVRVDVGATRDHVLADGTVQAETGSFVRPLLHEPTVFIDGIGWHLVTDPSAVVRELDTPTSGMILSSDVQPPGIVQSYRWSAQPLGLGQPNYLAVRTGAVFPSFPSSYATAIIRMVPYTPPEEGEAPYLRHRQRDDEVRVAAGRNHPISHQVNKARHGHPNRYL